MYILALVNIYSQVNHPEVGISTTDINRAKKIYSLSKEYNLNQPEIELYFIQTLFHSKSQEDILLAVRLTKEAITFYPERGIFNLIYGNYLAKSNQKPEEAVKQIKAGISKPGSIETIWQVVSSTTDLLSFGEADFVIETLEKYIEKNPQRHQLYMVMINAYIIKKDHELAMDNFRKAWAIYEQIKTHDKDDALKKELLDLKKQIDLLKK